MDETGEKKGWWGSTLSKLKTALSKTKTQITGVDEGDEAGFEQESQEQAQSEQAQIEQPQIEQLQIEQATLDQAPPSPMPEDEQLYETMPEQRSEQIERAPQPVSVPDPVVQSHAISTPARSDNATAGGERQMTAQVSSKTATVERQPRKHAGPAVPVDEDYLEDLEDKLIKADIGLTNVQTLIEKLRKQSKGKDWTSHDVMDFLREEFISILKQAPSSELKYTPGKVNIYLVVGVNGTGKTTSIGKLSWRFKQEGKKVLMAAGDTFRAAAESQLEIWSKRAGVDIVRLPDGSDPGAVVFNAINKAKDENYDAVVIDTAGRLHNKANLMDELKKIRGVVEKHGQGLPLECLLVLDASTGQNGLQQAKLFTEICSLTGVVLTKLDGTAKGGIVFSIARDLKIPVKLIGLGEQIDDLRDFEPELFVEALF